MASVNSFSVTKSWRMRSNSFENLRYCLTAGSVFGFQADIERSRFQTRSETAVHIIYQPEVVPDIIHQAGLKTAATQNVIHNLESVKIRISPLYANLAQK